MQIHTLTGSLARVNYESRARIVTSPTNDIKFDRKATIYEQLLNILEADKCHNRTIFDVCSGIQYGYSEFADWIRRSATAFSNRFVLAGDPILFIGEGGCEYLALYFGALAIGAVPKVLPAQITDFQYLLTECIQHSINILVISEKILQQLPIRKLVKELKIVSHVIVYNSKDVQTEDFEYEIYENVQAATDDDIFKPKNSSTAPALNVLNTSCSETYLYSHYSLAALWSIAVNTGLFECIAVDKALVYGSFEHIENILMLITSVASTCDIVVQSSFDLEELFTIIPKYQVTFAWLSANSTLCLLKRSLNEQQTLSPLLKIITFGGLIKSHFCEEFFKKYTTVKSIRHCFIRPQTPIPISIMKLNCRHYESIGFLLPNTRLKITTSESTNDINEPYRVGIFMLERERELFAIGKFMAQCSFLEGLPFEPLSDIPIVNPVLTNSEKYCQRYWLRLNECGYYDDESRIFWQGTLFSSKQSTVVRIRNCLFQNELFEALWKHKYVEDLGLVQFNPHHWISVVVFPSSYPKTLYPKLVSDVFKSVQDHIDKLSAFACESKTNKLSNILFGSKLSKTANGCILEDFFKTNIRDVFYDFMKTRKKY